jgi:hypothetical protein
MQISPSGLWMLVGSGARSVISGDSCRGYGCLLAVEQHHGEVLNFEKK